MVLIKSIIVLMVLLITISCTTKMFDYSIYDTNTGRRISLKRLARDLANYDVVMFGEFHGNITIHHVQAELLPLYLQEAAPIAISMEMFERDVQRVLDDYLAGNVSEEEFIKNSRAWYSYRVDYRPIIEFAKIEGVPVIASNVPRRIANEVNRFGLEWLDSLPIDERLFLPAEITITDDAYRDKFYLTMVDSPHISTHDLSLMEERLANLYAAQTIKDETMAESIYLYLRKNSDTKIIHFNGDFHSNSRLGVVTKLKEREPGLSIAVISPIIINKGKTIPEPENMRDIADYILVVAE